MRPKAAPIQLEREFYLNELFFSTTDKKGIIQSGNDVFARVSDYEMNEMLGQPHNMIRHPDMPRAVFKLLWDYLEADKSIVAYVKNLARDGRFYWVVALVIPQHNGYLSIRFKPSSDLFSVVQDLYKSLAEQERNLILAGKKPKEAMQVAYEKLQVAMQEKGFASYDAFMHFALRTELKSRETILSQTDDKALASDVRTTASLESENAGLKLLHQISGQSDAIAQTLTQVFSKLDDFVLMGEKLEGKVEFISDLAQSMRVLSLNTGIASSHLDVHSEVLTSIAKLMGENSSNLNTNVQRMGDHLLQISSSLKEVVYDLAAARLQLEMLRKFLSELKNRKADQQSMSQLSGNPNSAVARILTLQDTFSQTYKRGLSAFQQIEADLKSLTRDGSELQRSVQTLQFVHLVSRVEISRDSQLTGFGNILEEVLAKIQNTKSHLTDLSEAILYLLREAGGLGQIDRRVSYSLNQMSADAQLLETEFSLA